MMNFPFGIRLLLPDRYRSISTYRFLVLLFTYLSYCSYHLSRRPLSIVKNVLDKNCTHPATGNSTWCGWQPFDSKNGETLLGMLDSSFLITYALGMFASGLIAERCNLRYFLALGMLLSGIFTYALGLAFYYNIHSIMFFVLFQILSGLCQTTGWPAVVACVGNWFNKSSRGVIFGLWNSHTNVGNILGAVIAGAFVDYNWGLSFIVPGVIIGVVGFLNFLFLTPYPDEVGISSELIHSKHGTNNEITSDYSSSSQSSCETLVYNNDNRVNSSRRRNGGDQSEISEEMDNEESPLLQADNGTPINTNTANSSKHAISFFTALRIPGVIEFSICLFFAKLVSYTFLYWLPRYINISTHSSSSNSAYLSVPFDLGGIIGGVVAGFVVDRTGASAITCVVMLIIAIPSLYIYLIFGTVSNFTNIGLQVLAGTFVNGPYALITTAVSAELGTKVKSSQALATVTAIIDGTGSLGAAIGPFIAGLVANTGWKNVFFMVMISDALALLSLLRIAKQEFYRLKNRQSFIVIV